MGPVPEDWGRAAVVVAHPDDVEYGMASAVARFTRKGKEVCYVLATRGEAGIDGMAPGQAGPVREEEQRRSAAVVGVRHVEYLGSPTGWSSTASGSVGPLPPACGGCAPRSCSASTSSSPGARVGGPTTLTTGRSGWPCWTPAGTRPTGGSSQRQASPGR